MKLPGLIARSLKARLVLFTIAITLGGAIASGLYVSRLLRADLQQSIAAQQLAMSRMMAQTIDQHVADRLKALEQVALMAGLRMGGDPAALQNLLNDLPVFQGLFTGGTLITNARGIPLASRLTYGFTAQGNYSDRDSIQQALATGRPAIGKPVVGQTIGRPMVAMAAPVRDSQGRVAGVLVGLTLLNEPNFLDVVTDGSLNRSANYTLVAAQHRMVVTSSIRSRALEALPPPGVNPGVDRAIKGFQGSRVLVNPLGVEVLASVVQIPSAGWYVVVDMPTAAAFAPVHDLERRLMLVTGALTLLTAALAWWMIRRQLAPLDAAASSLAGISGKDLPRLPGQALPVDRDDEIGQLIHAFNQLLSELDHQRVELEKSETLYSTAFRTSPDAVSITRVTDGAFLTVNDSFTRSFGWGMDDIRHQTSSELGLWRHPEDRQAMVQMLRTRGRCQGLETEFVARDGRVVNVQLSAAPMSLSGEEWLLAVAHDITARKLAQRQIETLAFTDPLTGLPNRRLFMDRLNLAVPEAQQQGHLGALLFIDLDDFKTLNDSQGHDHGDMLLRVVARRLGQAVRASDTVARLGGDEFVILLQHLAATEAEAVVQARTVGQKLLRLVNQTARLGNLDYHGTASMGITLFGLGDDSASELLKHADLAMYHAKAVGRGHLAVFDPKMQDSLASRAELESALRAALGTDQLALHYQLQVGPDGQATGAEALLRWRHPERGPISPGEFIPVAERSRLIVPLGQWVMRTACTQLAAWASNPVLGRLTVSVNVSSHQFQQDDFVDSVLNILDETGAPPERLVLELTESLLVDNIEGVAQRMNALKARGLGFSLDDFGTGFSSLTYLKRLPLDELKIDQGFVRDIEADPNDLAIAGTIVALGDSLGLRVLAEGVENEAQQESLVSLGCRHFQGYLFGRPMPAAELEPLVRARNGAAEAPTQGA